MREFCLISALGDKENLQALEKINIVTPTSNLSDDAKFTILDFRVGALGSCVGFSDEMGKVNTFAESLIKRMARDFAVSPVQENIPALSMERIL
uniref:V-type proton ATPase subunit C n=1 Tax=Bos mutus grunniens TaxID=30521 RepID=A0A8B9X573_BOSMU